MRNTSLSTIMLVILAVLAQTGNAQVPSACSISAVSAEILFCMATDATVKIYINGTQDGGIIGLNDQRCSSWHWVAENSGPNPGGSCGFKNLDSNVNEVVEIKFEIDANAGDEEDFFATHTYEYTYFKCESGHDPIDDGFFCVNYDEGSKNDLFFVWAENDDGDPPFLIYPEGTRANIDPEDTISSLITTNDWIVPHHYEGICDRVEAQHVANCKSAASELRYFLSPIKLSDPIVEVITPSDENLIVPDGHNWTFSDIDFEFAASTEIIVEGELDLNNLEMSASGSSWGGITYASGSDGGDIESLEISGVDNGSGGKRNNSPLLRRRYK